MINRDPSLRDECSLLQQAYVRGFCGVSPKNEVEARFFAIAQNDNYLTVILNGANAQ
jgi:hypothetical protein